MPHSNEATRQLRERYVEGLPAKWWVLEEALEVVLQSEHSEAEKTLRRLAHQVRASAASFGFTAIDRASIELEQAESKHELIRSAERLIADLRAAHVVESESTTTTQSLRLSGTGSEYGDFTWQAPATHSKGAKNTGQTFQ